ncbi:hypothetical protein KM043_005235 [Ampulex compressa]|nr:hypothetical protein KM043_005235 [Ampulex compressa]
MDEGEERQASKFMAPGNAGDLHPDNDPYAILADASRYGNRAPGRTSVLAHEELYKSENERDKTSQRKEEYLFRGLFKIQISTTIYALELERATNHGQTAFGLSRPPDRDSYIYQANARDKWKGGTMQEEELEFYVASRRSDPAAGNAKDSYSSVPSAKSIPTYIRKSIKNAAA